MNRPLIFVQDSGFSGDGELVSRGLDASASAGKQEKAQMNRETRRDQNAAALSKFA